MKTLKKLLKKLGPGFVTGAADDDPSGIATYSIAGAQYGYRLNWLSLFLIPMMISIQEKCGRIGLASGTGLAGVIKKYYSKKLLYFAVSLLVVANVINIGADIGIMAASIEMLSGTPYIVGLGFITILSIFLAIFVPYKKYSVFLKLMSLSLVAYVVTALITNQNWLQIIRYTLIPDIDFTLPYFMTMVGFIGTTISPYLFFWQASEEVEEEIVEGKISEFRHRPNLRNTSIIHMQKDTALGMIFSNIISMFVVLTTAATLHANGIFDINSTQEAASALRPLAGDFAYLLFAFGIVGIGFQSIPVFAGGIAYALSETFGFKEGLGKSFKQAKKFYIILGGSIIVGLFINILGINPIKALYYAAIINGVVSVPLIYIIIRLADDERIVGSFKTKKIYKILGWITFFFIGAASIAMLLTLFM